MSKRSRVTLSRLTARQATVISIAGIKGSSSLILENFFPQMISGVRVQNVPAVVLLRPGVRAPQDTLLGGQKHVPDLPGWKLCLKVSELPIVLSHGDLSISPRPRSPRADRLPSRSARPGAGW